MPRAGPEPAPDAANEGGHVGRLGRIGCECVFGYYPGIGPAGFEHWADDGVPVSGVGIEVAWARQG
jgi:hypothetical protein